MIWQAPFYIVIIIVLIRASRQGDRMIAEMMAITARNGSHPARIAAVLKVKRTQKRIDSAAALLAVVGCWHVATLAGLL